MWEGYVKTWRSCRQMVGTQRFSTTDQGGLQALYQVSLDIRDAATREREIRALAAAMKETGIKRGTIVSLDTEERIETESGVIEVLPAWLWAMQ